MPFTRHTALWAGCLAFIGLLFLLERHGARGTAAGEQGIPSHIVVSSTYDSGPGSLREALFLAMRASHPVEISISVDRIELRSALPPIAGANGLTLTSSGDAAVLRGPDEARQPLIRVLADEVTVSNLHLEAAGAEAVFVAGRRFSLLDATITGASVGLAGSDLRGLVVTGSNFADNVTGVRLLDDSRGVIDGNRFSGHRDAGVWVVAAESGGRGPEPLRIRGNVFDGDRQSIVVGNAFVVIEDNELRRFATAGVTLLDSASLLSGNRISNGRGSGVVAIGSRGAEIVGNEIDNNAAVGIILKATTSVFVADNRLYENAYGIASVLGSGFGTQISNNLLVSQAEDGLIVIGDSPVVENNRSLRNGSAGIRLLDFLSEDTGLVVTAPQMRDNVTENNGHDDPQHGRYTASL